jgi:hypothetical protein
MVQMRAVRASSKSVKDQYLVRQEEGFYNIPLFNGPDNLTRRALKGLNEKLAV